MCYRLNGCCNHVAAILYRIEYAVRTGLTRPSSTSERCVWNVPSLDKAPSRPIILSEQVWTKDQYLKSSMYNKIYVCLVGVNA